MSIVIDVALDTLLIGIWSYVLYLVLRASREGYGGSLTASYPYIVGGFGMLFFMMVIEPLQQYFILGTEPSLSFVFSMALLQIVSGLMLVKAMISMYNLIYATEGVFNDIEVDEE